MFFAVRRDMKAAQRDRSAYIIQRTSALDDPLHAECADNLLDRLKDVVRKFDSCLVLGGAGTDCEFFVHVLLRTFIPRRIILAGLFETDRTNVNIRF